LLSLDREDSPLGTWGGCPAPSTANRQVTQEIGGHPGVTPDCHMLQGQD
jgi:hypothetical protein